MIDLASVLREINEGVADANAELLRRGINAIVFPCVDVVIVKEHAK